MAKAGALYHALYSLQSLQMLLNYFSEYQANCDTPVGPNPMISS